LLEIIGCQLHQQDFAQRRDDVPVNAVFVVELRFGPELGFGVVLIPKIQPLAEGHIRAQIFVGFLIAGFLQQFQLV
jgi:hypothetical protein